MITKTNYSVNQTNFYRNDFSFFEGVLISSGSALSTQLTKLTMPLYDLFFYLSDLPRWHIFAVFLVGYFVYYLIEVVKVSEKTL